MDFIKEHEYLRFHPNTLEEVRRIYNLNRPREMKEAVKILQEWTKQQAHFPKRDFRLEYLEAAIINSKGSIERAKRLIDKMCTVRSLSPKYFVPFHPKTDFVHLWDKNYLAILPHLTDSYYRIFVIKVVGKVHSPKLISGLFNIAFTAIDCLRVHDYNNGFALIFDLSETSLSDIFVHVNLYDLANCFLTILENYEFRKKKFHLISTSKLAEKIVTFFKPFIKKKIMDRVVINRSVEELKQYYSLDILPKEYGGSEKSISELHDLTIDMLSTTEHMEYMKSLFDARSDESLRDRDQFNDLYAGTVGTIRSLTLD